MKELIILLFIGLIAILTLSGIIVAVVLLIIGDSKKHKKEFKEYKNNLEPFEQKAVEIKEIDIKIKEREKYRKSYEPKYLLTINEKNQYRKLQKWANENNLIIFTKVRLLDLITPRKNQENYKASLWKIQAKHVDFVICDQNIRVKCIVEISDNSHKTEDQKERDTFVKDVLEACGYKVLATYNVTDEELNKICDYSHSTTDEQIPPFSV